MIKLQNVSFHYLKNKPLLSNIHLELNSGEHYVLIGPNGAGKTTLLSIMAGLTSPSSGEVYLEGNILSQYSAKQRARKVHYVTQHHEMIFPISVIEWVRLGLFPQLSFLSSETLEDLNWVEQCMKDCHCLHLKDQLMNEVSAGEKQRILLARALVSKAPLLLLDEVGAHFDLSYQIHLSEMIFRLQKKYQKTIVSVLHDLHFASLSGDKFIFLKEGKILTQGGREVLKQESLLRELFNLPHLKVLEKDEQLYFSYFSKK